MGDWIIPEKEPVVFTESRASALPEEQYVDYQLIKAQYYEPTTRREQSSLLELPKREGERQALFACQ